MLRRNILIVLMASGVFAIVYWLATAPRRQRERRIQMQQDLLRRIDNLQAQADDDNHTNDDDARLRRLRGE